MRNVLYRYYTYLIIIHRCRMRHIEPQPIPAIYYRNRVTILLYIRVFFFFLNSIIMFSYIPISTIPTHFQIINTCMSFETDIGRTGRWEPVVSGRSIARFSLSLFHSAFMHVRPEGTFAPENIEIIQRQGGGRW